MWIGERLTDLLVLHLKSNRYNGSIPFNLCNLRSIKILDLSINNLSGAIPSCIDNFTLMVRRYEHAKSYNSASFTFSNAVDIPVLSEARIMWKGFEHEYGKNLELSRLIDLSSNRLVGEISQRLKNLKELIQLNLSRNN